MWRAVQVLAATVITCAALVGADVAPRAQVADRHLSEPHAVLAGVTNTATGSAYTIGHLVNGRPLRWDPCTAIHWRFRAPGAPAGGLQVITAAVATIARRTGTTWVYDGPVREVPATRSLPRTPGSPSVLIGWADATSSDLLARQPRSVLGVTRSQWFGTVRGGVTDAWITSAVVALDRTDRIPATGPGSWTAVALHELSHAMGLEHAGSSRQLMYPVLQPRLAGLQSGDIAGLRLVGRAAGCR